MSFFTFNLDYHLDLTTGDGDRRPGSKTRDHRLRDEVDEETKLEHSADIDDDAGEESKQGSVVNAKDLKGSSTCFKGIVH